MSDPAQAAVRSQMPRLQMRGITKRYPGVLANDSIDLDVMPGEIHALLGENGAGKSTLMNILYGLAVPDAGEIRVEGELVDIKSPADAIDRGVSMVHQHFMLVPVLSVAENIVLGEETMRGRIFLDRDEAARRITELGRQFGFDIDPTIKVANLSVGWQQRVEILRALYREARILVMDEPTAVLTPQETLEIFGVLRRLAAEGRSIIFISHKLNEVLEIADRITVIRRGRVVGSRSPAETNADDLAEMMVGRDVTLEVDRGVSKPAGVLLKVEGLHAKDDRNHETVRGVSFEVRSGEILGIAGVAGNGQEELVESISGLRRASAGRIELEGRDITRATVRQRTRRGVAHVPGDRQRYGLVLAFPVADNLVLTKYYEEPYSRHGVMDHSAIRESARKLIAEYDIRTPSEMVAASTLSGGNQQKIVVAREFGDKVRLLLLDQPTRGLDVGSIEFIHRQVVAQRDAGAAVLLVSAELDEVLQLSDRIAVMYRGLLVAVVPAAEATREQIGLLMATGQTDPDHVDQPLERVG
jgi:ABC-type uncharacterized transport system ATPase subunit